MAALKPRGPRPGARRRQGFTVVELLVTMTLVLLSLALASQLLLESRRTFALIGREARDPLVGYAVAQLKSDILRATSASGGVDRLVLSGHPAGTVRWESEDDRLVRTVIDSHGGAATRTVLRRLTLWSWDRGRGPGGSDLVHVELGYRRHPDTPLAIPMKLGRERFAEERVSLTLAPRGGRRVDRW